MSRRFFQGEVEADYVGIQLEDAPPAHYRNRITRAVVRNVVELPALPSPPPEPGHLQEHLTECFFALEGATDLWRCEVAQLRVFDVAYVDVVKRDGRVYGRLTGRLCAELIAEPTTLVEKVKARITHITPLRDRPSGCLSTGCGAIGCSSLLGLLSLLALAVLAPTCAAGDANTTALLWLLALILLPVLGSSLFGLFTGTQRQRGGSGCGLLMLLGLLGLLLHPDCRRTPSQVVQVAQQVRDTALDQSASQRVLQELSRFFPQISATRMTVDQALAKPERLFDHAEQTVYISNDTLFLSGSSILLRPISPELVRLGTLLQQHPDASVIIEGHADAIGKPEDNLALSQKRANRVFNWLVEESHISPQRLQTKAVGATMPLVRAPLTDKAQAPNRRVEIRAIIPTKAK